MSRKARSLFLILLITTAPSNGVQLEAAHSANTTDHYNSAAASSDDLAAAAGRIVEAIALLCSGLTLALSTEDLGPRSSFPSGLSLSAVDGNAERYAGHMHPVLGAGLPKCIKPWVLGLEGVLVFIFSVLLVNLYPWEAFLRTLQSISTSGFFSGPARAYPQAAAGVMIQIIKECPQSPETTDDCEDGKVKHFRPTPTLLLDDFHKWTECAGGTCTFKSERGINGWLAFNQAMVVHAYTCQGHTVASIKDLHGFRNDCERVSKSSVWLRLPEWMLRGWSEHFPGFVFLVHNKSGDDEGYVKVGEDIINDRDAEKCRATRVSMWKWEYADLTQNVPPPHTGLFVEWERPQPLEGAQPLEGDDNSCNYGTVIELGPRGTSAGGRRGRSYWLPGKYEQYKGDDDTNWLLGRLKQDAPGMIQPYNTRVAEIRVWDLPGCSNAAEFENLLDGYAEGSKNPREDRARWRMVEFPPTIDWKEANRGKEVTLAFNLRRDLFRALLNYMAKEHQYDYIWRNCQTFATDLWLYMTNHATKPYCVRARPGYVPRPHWFLYTPEYLRRPPPPQQ
mmetsp:Transcript_69857/g.197947  ORF Transcript_69857/g.197947 Transcript_69857/m.197947 type:complete len:562 (+) Transcript_69857:67-1752(+)